MLAVYGPQGLPQLTTACAFPVYTAQAPGCSAGELSKAHPGFCALPRSQLLRFRFSGTPQGHRLGWALHIVPFPGLRSSGDQVLGECTAPGGLCILVTSLVPASWFPGYTTRVMSQLCPGSPLSGWYLAATLLADVNCPGSQEDLVNNWEPAHSLVEDAVSGAEIAPCLLALAVTRLPLCLQQGRGPVRTQLALLCYLLNPLFCEQARRHLRLELFVGNSLSLSLSLALSPFLSLFDYPTVWVGISH